MSMHSMLQEHMAAAQGLLQRVDALCGTQPRSMEGRGRLCRRLKAELRFLRRVEAGKVLIKESHLQSTNLAHLTAIVQSAESLADVVSVLHEFSYLDRGGTKRCLVVDVVANGGHAWVKAIGRKAEALHDVWQGRGKYGDRSIVSWAEDFLEASGQLPVQCSRPNVIFAFYNGVSRPMADTLRSMGVNMRGDIVAVNAEEEEEEEEEVGTELEVIHSKEEGDSEGDDEEDDEEDDDDEAAGLTRVDRHTVVERLAFPDLKVEECCRVNLDISTLITYVSSLSHGQCHFSFREQALTEQAAMERREEVLPKLDSFMKDKELFACQSAVRDFRVILDTLGGPGEKERAAALLARVRVVPDQPSERTHTVTAAASSKVNHRSLMIFGTGDALRAVTMTANVGFVKAAANQGVRYGVFIHQPRSLTEGKEWRATPI